jgi:RNA polymerase sigma-70 factor (sigma-E family)
MQAVGAGVGVVEDEGEFDRLYDGGYVRLCRLAYLLTGDDAAAEEITQEAFLVLSQQWWRVAAPDAYVRRVVVNRSRSWVRHRTVERRFVPEPRRETESDLSDRATIVAALAYLTARQRAAVVLRFYEDRSELEIAELLACRPGTVKSLVARGLATLREVLEP